MSVTTSTTKRASWKMHKGNVYARDATGQSAPPGRVPRSSRTPTLHVTRRVLSIVPPLVVAIIVLVSWYLSTTSAGINRLFLPAPGDVFTSLYNGLSSGMFFSNTLVTVQESVFGFLIAVAIALPLGYGLAKSRLLSDAIQPYLAAGQAIPAIVIAPLLVIWLGYGVFPNMIICMLVVLFPMVINTILGVQTIDSSLTDAARVEGAAGWSLLAHIEFPLALPAILAAVRTGFTLSITGAIVAEFVSGGDAGLGSLVLQAKNQFNTPLMFATLVVLAVLAALYYSTTWLLVRLVEAVY